VDVEAELGVAVECAEDVSAAGGVDQLRGQIVVLAATSDGDLHGFWQLQMLSRTIWQNATSPAPLSDGAARQSHIIMRSQSVEANQ
jgi:hypothetical protein